MTCFAGLPDKNDGRCFGFPTAFGWGGSLAKGSGEPGKIFGQNTILVRIWDIPSLDRELDPLVELFAEPELPAGTTSAGESAAVSSTCPAQFVLQKKKTLTAQ